MRRYRSGFTLIELLVVIAIIAILAAILFPVIASVKKRAYMASCLSNLKQLSEGIRLYADNYNDRCPNARSVIAHPDWIGTDGAPNAQTDPSKGQIWPYVRDAKAYLCSADYGRPALKKTDPYVRMHFAVSYSMNSYFRDDNVGPILMGSIRNPTRCLMLVHESRDTIDDGDFLWTWWNTMDAIHYDGDTISYADGHAVWKDNKQLSAEITRSKNDRNWWYP